MTPIALGLLFCSQPGTPSARHRAFPLHELGALDHLPLWALFILTILVLLLSTELGLRAARALGRPPENQQNWPLDEIDAANLSLLAFMLAFSFGLAASRFDARRTLIM